MSAALYRSEQQFSRTRILERKRETRLKIELGGLIKKAGLHEESRAVLLGLLCEAAAKLTEENAESQRTTWKILGDIAFTVG